MLFAIMSVSLISCGDDDEIGGRDTLVGKWQCTWSEGYEKYANNPEYNDEWNEERPSHEKDASSPNWKVIS